MYYIHICGFLGSEAVYISYRHVIYTRFPKFHIQEKQIKEIKEIKDMKERERDKKHKRDKRKKKKKKKKKRERKRKKKEKDGHQAPSPGDQPVLLIVT